MRSKEDREFRELGQLLDADPAVGSPDPLWPTVSAALGGRRSGWGRRFDPFVTIGVPAAVAAGLLLGVFGGAGMPGGPSGAAGSRDLLATGSEADAVAALVFAAEEGVTLGEIWWGSWGEEYAAEDGGTS